MEISKREKYNYERKKATQKKLLDGVRSLARTGRSVTKYALAKETGVSRRIIDNYPDVLDAIEKENDKLNEGSLTSVKPIKVRNLEEAQLIIDSLVAENASITKKYNELFAKYTSKDIEIAKLKSEVQELKQYLKSLTKKD